MNNNSSSGSPMTAMLLMGAVILLFMWLNQPKQTDSRLADELSDAPAATVATLADSLTPAQISTIVNTVRQAGVADSTGGYRLTTRSVNLRVDGAGQLTGTFDDGAIATDISQLLSGAHPELTPAAAASAVSRLMTEVNNAGRYQGFARYLNGDSTTVTLSNEHLTIAVTNKGGAIAEARLNEYKRYDSTAVTLITPGLDRYSFTLTTANQRFETSEFYFIPTEKSDTSVTMMLDLGGARWGLRYTLLPGSYLVKMDVVQQNIGEVLPPSTAEMDFSWVSTMMRNEAGRMFEENNSALYYKYAGGDVDQLSETKNETESVNERLSWVGYKNQFFSAILVAQDQFMSAEVSSSKIEGTMSPLLKHMSTEAVIGYSLAESEPAHFVWFFGPNSYPLMSDVQKEISEGQNLEFTSVIPLGWSLFRWINTLIIIPVFDFLGGFISNYGIIILLLTLFIKLILFPFTYKSYMSQAKMRVLTPEINAINEKWPGNENAMKRQQETMALYSRAGASPFSGCLPMLLQMPILIAMFKFFPSAIELRGESFLWAKDLSAPDAIVSWTTNIPFISSTFGNHISLFCLLMTVTNIIYTRVTMQSQPGGNQMPMMKWMMYLMPLMFLVFFNNYASGLSYYYFLSLLITIIQTYIFRRVVNEEKVRAQMRENAKKPRKKSGFMARLEETQRRQQQMLREQEKQRHRK